MEERSRRRKETDLTPKGPLKDYKEKINEKKDREWELKEKPKGGLESKD